MYGVREEGATDNVVLESSLVLKEMRNLKESLMLDGIKEVVQGKIPGADPASCERKGLRDFLGLNNKRKLRKM